MKLILVALIFSISLISCKKDKNVNEPTLDGTWEMKSYVALLPSLPVFYANDVIWNFNLTSLKLTITNNVSTTYPFLVRSGIYDIEVTDSTVKINNRVYTYYFVNEVLTIEYKPEVDGPTMSFTRK